MPRTNTRTAQPSRCDTEPHSGTTARTGMPVVASRPTVSGTPNARASTTAPAPPPQAVTSSQKPSVGTAATIVAQTRKRCRAVCAPLLLVIPWSLPASVLPHMSFSTQYALATLRKVTPALAEGPSPHGISWPTGALSVVSYRVKWPTTALSRNWVEA